MKKFFVFILFALLINCFCNYVSAESYLGTRIPLSGETLLPKNMQAVVLGSVYSKVSQNVRRCRNINLVTTKVTKEKENVEYNRAGKEIAGNWSEEWTVNACGVDVIVPIDFYSTIHGVRSSINDIK